MTGCQKENSKVHRRHLDATSPATPMRKHRGDRLESMLKDFFDLRRMLSLGVKLVPNKVTMVEESHQKTRR